MKLSINLRNWGPYSTRDLVLEFAWAVNSRYDLGSTTWIHHPSQEFADSPAGTTVV